MTEERIPKFDVGDVVRIANPDGYYTDFARKVRDRDAIVLEHVRDLPWRGDQIRSYQGRVMVEFQLRNGRGKKFTEVMHEKDFVPHRAKQKEQA